MKTYKLQATLPNDVAEALVLGAIEDKIKPSTYARRLIVGGLCQEGRRTCAPCKRKGVPARPNKEEKK